MNCPCGNEIVRQSYETPRQFEKKLASGFCRSKCSRIYAKPKAEHQAPTLALRSCSIGPAALSAQTKEVPEVDEQYRSWVRGMPCLVPGCPHEALFHHQNQKAHGGKGALCSDYRGLPLCVWHHTHGGTPELPGSYHGTAKLTGWRFWAHYGIDVEATIHRLNTLFLEAGHKFKGR